MGLDPSDAARAAMSEACSYVRRYPKLIHWMTTGDVDAEPVLDNIRERTAIKQWLRLQAFRREEEHLLDLLDKADTFVNHSGQAGRLIETFRQQRHSGKLDKLHPTTGAVHRAVFSLAIYQGAPVLSALRYVQTAVRAQSKGEIDKSHTAIQNHIKNLVKLGLFLDYDPGQRTPYHDRSGTISLELTPIAAEPDIDLILDLSLSVDAQIALAEFASDSKERNRKTVAELRERQAAMLASLRPSPTPEMFADILDNAPGWVEILRPTGESAYVPGRLGDVVFTEHGSRVQVDFAVDLAHVNGCESDYVEALMCPCNGPQVELHEEWVSWGLHPSSGVTSCLSA